MKKGFGAAAKVWRRVEQPGFCSEEIAWAVGEGAKALLASVPSTVHGALVVMRGGALFEPALWQYGLPAARIRARRGSRPTLPLTMLPRRWSVLLCDVIAHTGITLSSCGRALRAAYPYTPIRLCCLYSTRAALIRLLAEGYKVDVLEVLEGEPMDISYDFGDIAEACRLTCPRPID